MMYHRYRIIYDQTLQMYVLKIISCVMEQLNMRLTNQHGKLDCATLKKSTKSLPQSFRKVESSSTFCNACGTKLAKLRDMLLSAQFFRCPGPFAEQYKLSGAAKCEVCSIGIIKLGSSLNIGNGKIICMGSNFFPYKSS